MGLQRIFTGNKDIVVGEAPSEIEGKDYSIRYSPAIIFSNMVPGLDANFINPSNKEVEVVDIKSDWKTLKSYSLTRDKKIQELKDDYGFDLSEEEVRIVKTDGERYFFVFQPNGRNVSQVYEWEYDKDGDGVKERYKLINTEAGDVKWTDSLVSMTDNQIQSMWDSIESLIGKDWTLFVQEVEIEDTGKTIASSAKTLQPSIAKWYKGLRLVAIVGLLSVLVYVGIRIILSSTGQDKSKYKKMMTDWVAAICILFILQYIMSFTITMTSEIINIFPNAVGQRSVVDSSTGTKATINEDTLMTGIRNKIPSGNSDSITFYNIFAETVIYVALVVLTVMFTVQYLKRLIYLAFLTMISPLIALTYPLDKIKDGQAQAFTLWIREYVFNSLLPVIHLLIYTIFVTEATNLVDTNPIYAVVCIGFMVPAEKFIRKMFGFDKASTAGPLGAAAGGALMMNAINKIGNTNIKNDSKGENKPVRTTGLGGGNTWSPGNRVYTPGSSGGGRKRRKKSETVEME